MGSHELLLVIITSQAEIEASPALLVIMSYKICFNLLKGGIPSTGHRYSSCRGEYDTGDDSSPSQDIIGVSDHPQFAE